MCKYAMNLITNFNKKMIIYVKLFILFYFNLVAYLYHLKVIF